MIEAKHTDTIVVGLDADHKLGVERWATAGSCRAKTESIEAEVAGVVVPEVQLEFQSIEAELIP